MLDGDGQTEKHKDTEESTLREGTVSAPWVPLPAVISAAITANGPWAGLKEGDEMLMGSLRGSTGENRKAVE